MVTWTLLPLSLLLPKPKALPVRHSGFVFVFLVGEGPRDGRLDPASPIPQRLMPFNRQHGQKALNQGHHSAGDLYTVTPAIADLIQGKPQKIFPGWKGNHESERAFPVPIMPDFQMTSPEPKQEVLDLIQLAPQWSGR